MLGEQTKGNFEFQIANSAQGQHIHYILNNGPYSAHYENSFKKTLNNFLKVYSHLPSSRRKELIALIPLAILSGLSEVLVLGILARLFNFLSGQPRESIFLLSEFFDFDPFPNFDPFVSSPNKTAQNGVKKSVDDS